MRIGLDATPLLGVRTGVGRYTEQLLQALAPGPDELVATAFTFRGRDGLAAALPAGITARSRPAPARLLQEMWARSEWPPVEALTGRLDVFHATNYVLPPLRRAAGIVSVHDLAYLHMPDVVSTASARYRELVPRSLERASAVLTLSEAVTGQLHDAYDLDIPVHCVPLGVDPSWAATAPPDAALRSRLGLPASYLVFVGTLEPRKDLRTLLAALRLVPDPPPLVLVGPPGWGEQVDVTGCLALGYLDAAVLRSVVAGAAALVMPSRDEGFGLPVIEALATGVPVVASDLPVLREVGGDVTTYAAVGDPESFAEAIGRVLADPGDAGRRREHAGRFTWERTAELTRTAYRAAAGG